MINLYLFLMRKHYATFVSHLSAATRKRMENHIGNYKHLKQQQPTRIGNTKHSKNNGFNSKLLSKYILQNVIEFLDWRKDIFIRGVCKKLKDAWDLNLLRISVKV
jgi:hypothetical protein